MPLTLLLFFRVVDGFSLSMSTRGVPCAFTAHLTFAQFVQLYFRQAHFGTWQWSKTAQLLPVLQDLTVKLGIEELYVTMKRDEPHGAHAEVRGQL